MKCTSVTLIIGIITSSIFSILAETCLEDWNLSVEGCDYGNLVDKLEENLDGCSHGAESELKMALNLDSEDEVKEKIAHECSKGYFPWEGVSKQGYVFDKEIFDGGTYYNEEIESLDEFEIFQHRLADDPGPRIKEIYNKIAEKKGIEFPYHLTNFEDCELRAVMCCFVQDRQADDDNGNCATPYEENCMDADPADNTDICYHDMENSPTASRTPAGYAIFDGDEGDSHCHGFAWADDQMDETARVKGNSLFQVTLYDHLITRGYVGNVPGAPKCACIEQMPVVTRSDCTQTAITNEEVQFSYSDGDLNATVTFDITFDDCQGANNKNNDLEAYYEQLKNDGKASQDEFDEIRKHLVGDCNDPIANFLETKGLRIIAA